MASWRVGSHQVSPACVISLGRDGRHYGLEYHDQRWLIGAEYCHWRTSGGEERLHTRYLTPVETHKTLPADLEARLVALAATAPPPLERVPMNGSDFFFDGVVYRP